MTTPLSLEPRSTSPWHGILPEDRDLGVEAEGNVVVLTGTVASREEWMAAWDAAAAVPGVRFVYDRVAIAGDRRFSHR